MESVTTARSVAHKRVMFPLSVLFHNSHSLLELSVRSRSEGPINRIRRLTARAKASHRDCLFLTFELRAASSNTGDDLPDDLDALVGAVLYEASELEDVSEDLVDRRSGGRPARYRRTIS